MLADGGADLQAGGVSRHERADAARCGYLTLVTWFLLIKARVVGCLNKCIAGLVPVRIVLRVLTLTCCPGCIVEIKLAIVSGL
jgi:hypothetical protein